MKAVDQKIMSMEMNRLLELFRERIQDDIRMEVKRANRELCDVLTGLGILSPEKTFLTREQVMKQYRVGKSKLNEMMRSGKLPYRKTGDTKQSRVLFDPVDVIAAFEEEVR